MTLNKSISLGNVEEFILVIRGHKVILDSELARLYNVETKVLNQAVKRNLARFPIDFMFQLTREEFEILRSQNVTSSQWGGRRTPPYAFTEQGIAMLSGVLNSDRAIQVNIAIMRVFVKMRRMIVSNKELSEKLSELEKRYDKQFTMVFQAIRELMAQPKKDLKTIGFINDKKNDRG